MAACGASSCRASRTSPSVRILRYRPFQRFRWHTDARPEGIRKLTCIVALSPRGTHWRGGLEVRGEHQGRATARREGSVTWFPSYVRHRATAPWWGERWVLVTWLTGASSE